MESENLGGQADSGKDLILLAEVGSGARGGVHGRPLGGVDVWRVQESLKDTPKKTWGGGCQACLQLYPLAKENREPSILRDQVFRKAA